MDLEELQNLIGAKEIELHVLRKHISNLEEQVRNLQVELANSPTMELIQVPKGEDPLGKKKK